MSDKEIVALLKRIDRSLRKIQRVVAPDEDVSVADVSPGPEVVELTEARAQHPASGGYASGGYVVAMDRAVEVEMEASSRRFSSQAGLASIRRV